MPVTLKIFDWDNALDFYAYDEDGEIELCYDVEEVRLIADTLNKWLEGK